MTKEELKELCKQFILDNKNKDLSLTKFIKYGKSLVRKNTINDFKNKPTYFNNLYYKLLGVLFPLNSEDMYNYSEKINNNIDFCRSNLTCNLITSGKKKFTHRHMIFFNFYENLLI